MSAAGTSTRRELRAGHLSLMLDGIDLRYLRVGETEVVRRIYAAVRDHNWATIPAEVESLTARVDDDGFVVEMTARHRAHDIDFTWHGVVEGRPNGSIRYELRGLANTSFRYNRIGFCVLTPSDTCGGQAFVGHSPEGPVAGRLPRAVAPQRFENGVYVALTPPLSEIAIDLPGGGAIRTTYEGDLFEIEDQRNWSDASFKCYSTPLSLGMGHHAEAGQEFFQAVVCQTSDIGDRPRPAASQPTLAVGAATGRRFPALGSCIPSDGAEPTDDQVALLRALELNHIRCDLRLTEDTYAAEAARAAAWAHSLECPLELAVHVTEESGERLAALAELLKETAIARVLVFDALGRSATPTETTAAPLVQLVRGHLGAHAPMYGGSDMHLAELNRRRLDTAAVDGVTFSVAAEVHAFDDLSVMETPTVHADAVETVIAFAAGLPVAVSPITLRQRFNAVAVEDVEIAGDQLPPSVDPRQREPLAAAFLAASIGGVADGGADSATYFQLTGWEGLMEHPAGSPLPDLFPSGPGEVFPCYHVLAGLAGRQGAEMLACRSSHPLAVAGFAFTPVEGPPVVVMTNLTESATRARLERPVGGALEVELAPYGVEVREL